MKDRNERVKKIDLGTLNELIDEFLSVSEIEDVSPLLKVYDDLKVHTKLTMPVKSVLQ